MEAKESHSVQSQFRTKTGVTLEELAMQCHERFPASEENELDPWEDLHPNNKVKWMEATEATGEFIGREIETSFQMVAKRFAGAFYGEDRWNSLPVESQLGYQIVVRHIINMVTAEDAEDVKAALEYDWGQWLKRKLKETES